MRNGSEILDFDVQETLLEKATLYSKPYSFAAGEVIMSPAETTKTFYYVAKGTVEVSYTDQNDTRITVALIGEGEFFGEIGFFLMEKHGSGIFRQTMM